jgi:uncharacterized protein (DUF2236 family)
VTREDFSSRLRAWSESAADPVAGFFGPASVTWKINREAAVYLGGLRALLMQIAHPKVAQGVADHSNFRHDPFARLRRTFDTVHAMVFGTRAEAVGAAERLWSVHLRVRGSAVADGGARPYAASDPDLLLWVLATLVDSSLHTYETFFPPLARAERAAFYDEAKTFARLCGLEASDMPAGLDAFEAYVRDTLASPTIAVTPAACEIADALLKGPPLLWMFRPSNYVLAAGTLPPGLRDAYGLPWTLPVRAAFAVGVKLVRTLTPHLPPALRIIPSARRAERRCGRVRLAA